MNDAFEGYPSARERYVALGDSYTIGEGVEEAGRWPNRLTEHLRQAGVAIDLVANPSVTGWTTSQLIEHELPIFETSHPTVASLLIGVNDWVQGVPLVDYRERLVQILDRVQATLPDPGRVLLVTIPDFSVTPEGSTYGKGRDIPRGIAAFNEAVMTEADRRSLPVADIFPLSQALAAPEFVAPDGLHPSSAAYERWEWTIYPAARSLFV